MATNIRDGYMSPQVWVAKREQKVIEVLDRLVPARVEYAENIFAGEKYLENGMVKREYALLTMVICEGKGAERKQVRFNFSPDNFSALRRECEPSIYAGRSYRKAFIKRNCNNGELKIRAVTITFEQYQKDREGALLIITHSTRILESLHVDYTHVMVNGHIVATGDGSMVEEINEKGYERFLNSVPGGDD